jgi:hypothetical protein
MSLAGRREFLEVLLAGCAGSNQLLQSAGQTLPADNPFQAGLSHLYFREAGQLFQILLTDTDGLDPSATLEATVGSWTKKYEIQGLRHIGGQYYIPIKPAISKRKSICRTC